jgi:L-seryl-tRNA(Ser) seleniumtransferase
MDEVVSESLRAIPSVSVFVESAEGAALAREFGEGALKLELRALLDEVRAELRAGGAASPPDAGGLASRLRTRLVRLVRPDGRRAVNATGVILHTGLGRGPLSDEAAEAVRRAAGSSIVQTNIETGGRSRRDERIERLLRALTGCEAATVVNNNAAAVMLALNALAEGREVLISRGQLIEIGGSFRMPDVMARSGALLREVGTTNRTHLADYEAAVGERTAAVMHVHTSNYRIRGFASTPPVGELAGLARARGLALIDDIGSGALVPLGEWGLPAEPLVGDSVAAGADCVCFSGDKLLSGPQAGVIVGKEEAVARLRRNPFARMFRVGKLTLAGLEATLLHYLNGDHAERIPLYRMLSTTLDELEARAEKLAAAAGEAPGASVSVADGTSYVGGGSVPDEGVPTRVVRLGHEALSADEIARRLRRGLPSVYARIEEDAVVLDMRTLLPGEDDLLCRLVPEALG